MFSPSGGLFYPCGAYFIFVEPILSLWRLFYLCGGYFFFVEAILSLWKQSEAFQKQLETFQKQLEALWKQLEALWRLFYLCELFVCLYRW